jgi:hypothetical protein
MPTADEDRIDLRRAEALRLRCRGYSVREIGLELGISKSVAADDVRKAMGEAKKLSQDELDAERSLELHRIDTSLRVIAKIIDGVMFDSTDGAKDAADSAGMDLGDLILGGNEMKLKAIDRQVKLQQERSKLLGLYAPQKVEAEVNAVGLDELDALRKAAAANGCLAPTTTDSSEPNS